MTARPSSSNRLEPRPDSPRFSTGRLLAGRYELVALIGDGATAEVFRARDHRLDRTVAVKVLRPQYGRDADARERFAVEARSAAALAVPNIVPVYDFGATDDGSLFIVMRCIDGPSLRHLLAERGALPPAQVVDIGRQIAAALAAAHEHGLIHRDVKPGNILIDAAGTAHLTDFGTVKVIAGAADLTRTGMTFGTASYIAPEQATGRKVGAAADIYALGAVMYQALAGRPPFTGEDPIAVSYRHVHEQAEPIGLIASGLPLDLADLVMQCLAKAPGDRPATAGEVANRLDEIARRMAPPPPPVLATLAPAVPRARPPQPPDLDAETVYMPVATAPPTVAVALPGAVAGTTVRRVRPRTSTAASGALVLLLLALLAVLLLAILPLLLNRNGAGPAALGPTASATPRHTQTAGPTSAPTPTQFVVVPPVATDTPTVAPPPPVPPTAAATPQPTNPTTPGPTPQPTPRRTPPPASPTPPSTTSTVTARIPDALFAGDYDGPGSGTYHGRTASWVYGQGTPYGSMTAQFTLDYQGRPAGQATLTIVGLDGDNPAKQPIAISFNGTTIYQGLDPLPNDFCCGPSGAGNWGTATFSFAANVLQRQNTLTITNLGSGTCTQCPTYVMVDYADLSFRVRQ